MQRAPFALAEIADPRPADVAAAQAFGGGRPQRGGFELSMTTAAEALDHERLHAHNLPPIGAHGVPRPGDQRRGQPEAAPSVLAQGLTVAAQASCESGPFPVQATATRLPVESIPR